MKRIFDFIIAFIASLLLLPLMLLVGFLVKITSPGPALYWSKRVGRYGKYFRMPKFRSMLVDTPNVASHLLKDHLMYLTPIGATLRKLSLDEMPQLWSILIGDMSFVGPRPALFNQIDLIKMREKFAINNLKPGLTGLAQINGRDDLSLIEKVNFDREYLNKQSMYFDIKIMLMTFIKVILCKNVSH